MKKITLILVCLLALVSCSKDDDSGDIIEVDDPNAFVDTIEYGIYLKSKTGKTFKYEYKFLDFNTRTLYYKGEVEADGTSMISYVPNGRERTFSYLVTGEVIITEGEMSDIELYYFAINVEDKYVIESRNDDATNILEMNKMFYLEDGQFFEASIPLESLRKQGISSFDEFNQ